MKNMDKLQDETVERLANKIKSLVEEIHKLYAPLWEGRTGILKTIITLSSGSIILSVTFSASLRSASVGPLWRWLALGSFVLFVIALVVSFFGLWFAVSVYDLQSNVFGIKRKIAKAVNESASSEDLLKALDQLADQIFNSVGNSDRYANRLVKAGSICFCLALLLLAAIGVRQLLP